MDEVLAIANFLEAIYKDVPETLIELMNLLDQDKNFKLTFEVALNDLDLTFLIDNNLVNDTLKYFLFNYEAINNGFRNKLNNLQLNFCLLSIQRQIISKEEVLKFIYKILNQNENNTTIYLGLLRLAILIKEYSLISDIKEKIQSEGVTT